ncbi:MAG TPA: amidohydrolase family protein [Marmoricola sp.]|nr:amidohydrolase family protein [Marmoricola sp.]
MPALRFHGPVLPDGQTRDLYVVNGRVTYEAQTGSELAATGWMVPGLVDAHCHLGLDDGGAISRQETEQQALADRDQGALLIRDCGSASDTRWIQERTDLPRLIRAGRHIAATRRYIRNYADEVDAEDLVAAVRRQARLGDGWVKLVGDWISRESGDLAPSFPAESFAAAISAAHEEHAKVTAHCFGREVLSGLIDAGIDCIEHGTGLTTDLIDRMVASGTALVPTVMQTEKFTEHAANGREKFPRYAQTMTELYATRREVLMSAYEAGVQLYAGSDGGGVAKHGNLFNEVIAMAQLGIPYRDALGAASWRARTWLGLDDNLAEGTTADFVVYDQDPLTDLNVLAHPTLVVLRGQVVSGRR